VRAVSRTDDTRIPARILTELHFDGRPESQSVLSAGLRHPSSDVRRRAARALGASASAALAPLVEERFGVETDEGVRRDLMAALGDVRSRRYLAELRAASQFADPATRRVALRSLMAVPEDASVAVLKDEALDPDNSLGLAVPIVRSLFSWSSVPSAHVALVDIGRRGPREIATYVIREFGDSEHADIEALYAIANVRTEALDRDLNDFALKLIQSLQGDSKTEKVTFSCGFESSPSRRLPLATGNEDEFGRDFVVVTPADGRKSVRCWDAPGYMWPAEIRPRLLEGAEGWALDEFSWGGERWLAVIADFAICWVPQRDVGTEEIEESEEPVLDLDMTVEDAQSPIVAALERADLLSWLESEGDLLTARIASRLDDPEAADAVVRIYREGDPGAIRLALGTWLENNLDDFEIDEEEELTEASLP